MATAAGDAFARSQRALADALLAAHGVLCAALDRAANAPTMDDADGLASLLSALSLDADDIVATSVPSIRSAVVASHRVSFTNLLQVLSCMAPLLSSARVDAV